MKQRLSYTDTKVLKTLGSWTDQTIHEHELVKYFSFKAARVSVLVVGSYLGYKRLYVYYFRWHKDHQGDFHVTSEFYDDHQPSLRACAKQVHAWQKENAL
ncbi:MAG: hypothetical protein KDB07_08905 [Planctomycetes bacterium]|nr:hypothetical protein [Planctomycetota bacterium]